MAPAKGLLPELLQRVRAAPLTATATAPTRLPIVVQVAKSVAARLAPRSVVLTAPQAAKPLVQALAPTVAVRFVAEPADIHAVVHVRMLQRVQAVLLALVLPLAITIVTKHAR